jgi:hypothetical protein
MAERESLPPDEWRSGAGDSSVVRYVRPIFREYVDATFDEGTLAEYIADRVSTMRGQPPPGDDNRLYGGTRHVVTNRGADSYVNGVWAPGHVTSNSFFFAQTTVGDFVGRNMETQAEFIGWIIGRNSFAMDAQARLFSEFYTAGLDSIDDYIGGWSGPGGKLGFVPAAGAGVALGDLVPGVSSVDGSQYAHRMLIEYFSSAEWSCPTSCSGTWWLLYDSTWVGYYPVGTTAPNVFFDKIDNSSAHIDWYGEVYDDSAGVWTNTDMGSPEFASASSLYGKVGYFRALGHKPSSGGWTHSSASNLTDPGGTDSSCYTKHLTTSSTPAWKNTLWFGGPGGDEWACNPF